MICAKAHLFREDAVRDLRIDGDRRQEPVSPLFGSLISTLLGEQPFAPTERNRHTIL
ncbi:hypothetical protein PHOSAC3_150412 [Mesotoga infera]|nr:hypothetical protein PHOSAC3_150412 [Mesotoga infera]